MTAQDALESLASSIRAQAVRAIGEAQDELCGALDAKMAEIASFRAQVRSQTKSLQDLVATSRQQQRKLADPQIEQLSTRALDVQGAIERVNQKVRVLEETQARIDRYK